MFAKIYRKLSKMVVNWVLGYKKNEPFSTGVRLNQIGGVEGIRTPVQKQCPLNFYKFS